MTTPLVEAPVVSGSDEFVVGDPLWQKAVAADGTVLPVNLGCIEIARSKEWDYQIGKTFNSIYYSALHNAGLKREQIHAELDCLMRHRLPFGMTPVQVRVAYGIQQGIMGRNGRFKDDKLNGTNWEVKLMQAKAQPADRERRPRGFSKDDWPRLETDALAACQGLCDQVDIALEFRWIVSKMREWPDFRKAPSQTAVKMWLAVNDPGGIDPAVRDLLNMAWTKRLSPGDRGSKKKSAFAEDEAGEAAEDASVTDAERMRQLFGDHK